MRAKFLSLLMILVPACFALADEKIDYVRDVKPILKARCYACHGALKQKARLRLDTAELIRKGGRHGAAIAPGQATKSIMIERVSATDVEERMPPEGKPLSQDQVALLRAWINQGANAPKSELPEEDPTDHWAFKRPARPTVPNVQSTTWIANPIDAFIAAQHEKHAIKPLPPAQKSILLRRLYLDLIGLPPTSQEMHDFLNDGRADAYERVVDRLLSSPAYGERWGKHWMDVWRYTDWYGLGQQLRYSQKHVWHWRDWIIESLNNDKSYDRMILEMLAADEIAPTDQSTLRASGFLARNYFLFNRTTWLDNTIEHTSKAFLGLTIQCAKCHDHKYDPIKQVDFYRFRAIFEPHQVRLDQVPGEIDLERDGLPRVFDAHPAAQTHLHVRGNEKDPDKSVAINPGIPDALAFDVLDVRQAQLPATGHYPALHEHVLDNHLRAAKLEVEKAKSALALAKKQLNLAKSAQNSPKPISSDATGIVFIKDDFAKPNPEVWEVGPGKWKHNNGRLEQSKIGATRAWLRSRKLHPRDFQATLRFKTLGGERWKSVGLCFDVVDGREKMVYLSAVSPGSKLQVSYKKDAKHVYPPSAAQPRKVELNVLHVLTIQVRDRLINVNVNGARAIAYNLPITRENGRLDVVAFDAAVELTAIEVRELPRNAVLIQPGANRSQPTAPLSIEQAKKQLTISEKALAVADLRPEVLRAVHRAEVAKHQSPPPENLKALILKAARLNAKWEHAKARLEVLKAEENLRKASAKTKAPATKAVAVAKENLAKAEKHVADPGETYQRLRGSSKAAEGPAESAAERMKPYPKITTGRRTALAKWIIDERNPLTARVAVNHLWLRHFGQPLVESVTDFGRRAPQPIHHELLDWLAVELIDSGWSMKQLHRLMVTSQTYRLSGSTVAADSLTKERDPQNDYYWHRTPIRMEAQVVRDSLLGLAGTLDRQMYGPTIDPKANGTVRRSLYFTRSRDHVHPFLDVFDDADIRQCYRRKESIKPQQALTLSNSRLALQTARTLTAKLEKELGTVSDKRFIELAFEMILCVKPTTEERALCLDALLQTKKLLFKRADASSRARQNLVHALLNHNDFITIR